MLSHLPRQVIPQGLSEPLVRGVVQLLVLHRCQLRLPDLGHG